MNTKDLKNLDSHWRHCMVVSAGYQGLRDEGSMFNSDIGTLMLESYETIDSRSLIEGQNVEIHFLESIKDSELKKVVVDSLFLEPLSEEETLF